MRVQLIRYHDLDNTNTRLAQSLNKKQGVLPPLGVAYIASSLEKAGHEVNIIDAIALALSKEQVLERIKKIQPESSRDNCNDSNSKRSFRSCSTC